jgi:hypothetical protein
VSATLAHIHFYVLASRAMASSSGSPQICLLFFKKKERKKSSVAFCAAVVIQSLRFKKKNLQMQLERQMGTGCVKHGLKQPLVQFYPSAWLHTCLVSFLSMQ